MPSAALAVVLRIVVTGACLLLAFVGFVQAYPVDHRSAGDWLDLAYRAVQLTFGKFPDELRGKPIPMALQVARFALPAAAAWSALSLGWIQLRNKVRGGFIRRRGDHLIVFGEGRLAEGMIKGERARKGKLIAWVEDAGGRLARETEALGGAHADGPRDTLPLRLLGLETARAFVAAADSDAANLAVARRALDYALEHRKPGDPLQLIARVDDVALQGALEARLTRKEQRDRVELRLASAPQLVAREFLLANPIDRMAPVPGQPVRLAWLGWSPLAESMLVRVLAASHFRQGGPPELVVADLNAGRAEAAFRSRREGAFEIAPIRFETLHDDAPTLIAEWAAKAAAERPFNALYVTLPEASAALSTALALETAFGRRGLAVPSIYAHLPEAGAATPDLVEGSLVQPFGALAALADPEELLQEKLDEVARSIHDFYLEGRLNDGEAIGDRATLAEWRDLPESVRDENRLVADCYRFKLRDIGAAVVEGEGPSLRFTDAEVEDLSRAEHRRWMAAKLLDGWVHGETRDDRAKRHPDIVPYDQLSERIKDLDREQIRMIPRLLAASGRRALRDLVVELRPGSSVAPSRETVRSTLQDIAAEHPDRRLVVRGDPADAAARAVLLHADALGHGCELVLSRPVEAMVDAAGADRSAVARLIRTAVRVHAPGLDGGVAAVRPADLSVELGGDSRVSPARAPAAAAA